MMNAAFVPSAPNAGQTAAMDSPERPFFPPAVSTPVSSSDWLASEHLHRMAASRTRASADRDDDVEEGAGSSAAALHTPPRNTFSIEQPGTKPDTPQDVPLMNLQWTGQLPMRSVSSSHPQWHQGSSAEPATPPRPFRSPAKSYPTPEPSLDPYAGSKGGGGRSFKLGGVPGSVDGAGGLLAAAPRRQWCPRPLTLIIITLVLLAVMLIGLTVGHYVLPFIRTVTLPHAPAPLPASKPLEALPAGTTAGSDGMDSVMGVGIGLEVDSSIGADSSSSPPALTRRNPYLDLNRQGQGVAAQGQGTGISAVSSVTPQGVP